jgi:hypothetical protein
MRRVVAVAAATTATVAMVMTLAMIADAAGRGGGVPSLLQTKLAEDEEQSQDAGFELDYGKESGVEEAMNGARDDQMNIMMMKAPGELGGDVNMEKLARLQTKMKKFEEEEADFLKVAQHPAEVTISVTNGLPGLQGKRGFRGQAGGQGPPGPPGRIGKTGVSGPCARQRRECGVRGCAQAQAGAGGAESWLECAHDGSGQCWRSRMSGIGSRRSPSSLPTVSAPS